jgi:hypothetical protein
MSPRVVRLVHTLPGRTRLRCLWLHRAPREAAPLADALAVLPGMREVRVRPYTGGVLCLHDPARLDAAAVVARVREHTQPDLVLGPHDVEPLPPPPAEPSSVARAAAAFFRELNQDILRATGGRTDLGTLATLGFMGAGALEVALRREIPIPPWFNLAWWGFRTFMTLEGGAIDSARQETRGG